MIWVGPMQSWGSLKVGEESQREMYLWKNNERRNIAGFAGGGKGQRAKKSRYLEKLESQERFPF